jgi:hypothetical protein
MLDVFRGECMSGRLLRPRSRGSGAFLDAIRVGIAEAARDLLEIGLEELRELSAASSALTDRNGTDRRERDAGGASATAKT